MWYFKPSSLTIPLLAHVAFERFLVRVNTHVVFKWLDRRKRFSHTSHSYGFSFVWIRMWLCQITRLSKTLLAHITFIRFLVRVSTHVSGQIGWISKHLLANIALVRSLPLPSLRRRLFFSYLLLLDFKNDFILVRNLQTQHRFFFFHFFFFISRPPLQNRPRVHRALRMWILSSHVIISIISRSRSSSACACVACGVGTVFSPNEEIFVKTAVFFSWKKQSSVQRH